MTNASKKAEKVNSEYEDYMDGMYKVFGIDTPAMPSEPLVSSSRLKSMVEILASRNMEYSPARFSTFRKMLNTLEKCISLEYQLGKLDPENNYSPRIFLDLIESGLNSNLEYSSLLEEKIEADNSLPLFLSASSRDENSRPESKEDAYELKAEKQRLEGNIENYHYFEETEGFFCDEVLSAYENYLTKIRSKFKPEISAEEIEIIKIFENNVYGKSADTTSFNQKHDGKDGHWLEKQMGIVANSNNEPDLYGYEMKNSTGSKTTFGDWSASYYIFSNKESNIDRTQFMEIFGKPNEKKDGRFSWSGSPIPNFNSPSTYNGSEMLFDDEKNIVIVYNYSKDPRGNKVEVVPLNLQQDGLILARWDRENLNSKLTKKFGHHGWFKCNKDKDGFYNEIAFGEPMVFDNWIKLVEQGVVFFDSGMYVGNARNYSQWRANNNHWDSLITRTYPPFPGFLDSSQ